MATYNAQLQQVVGDYMESGEPWPATTDQIAAWAIRRKKWAPHPAAIRRQCADDLARAMREDYITDAHGRRIRAKHVARVSQQGRQMCLWADIRTASREHMQLAFAQRRQQIVGDCRQLQIDVESYNESRSRNNPIQVVFDFRADLEELDAAEAS